jgi:hypothetical protein
MHADRADSCAHYAAGVPMTPEQLAERVLTWYAVHGRDLPWRHTRDPYAILVSEVMLQQTQVERVIERWTAWLERWPTAAALAAAPRAEVIAAWQGLGYNRRAVALHEGDRLRCGDTELLVAREGATPRAVADGYQLLTELGAIDEARRLTCHLSA